MNWLKINSDVTGSEVYISFVRVTFLKIGNIEKNIFFFFKDSKLSESWFDDFNIHLAK